MKNFANKFLGTDEKNGNEAEKKSEKKDYL
jgi:hypothetical protein